MKYEKLNSGSNNKKVFLYGFITCAILLIVFNLFMSYAKYKSVDSVKLAEGTINYESADLNIIAMYKDDGDGDKSIEEIPEGNYTIDKEKSYCIIGNDSNKIKGMISYEANMIVTKFTKKGTKCYVYFKKASPSAKVLADLKLQSQGEASTFAGTACGVGCDINENGVYEAEDDYGTSYYFRGNVSNNWVKFGQVKNGNSIYWRIIRINGNGSIRLIYAGEEGSLGNGNGRNIIATVSYNTGANDNKFLGFMFGSSDIPTTNYAKCHSNDIKSNILNELEKWWNNNTNLENLLEKIDGSTGFCNDRQSYNGSSANSTADIVSHGYGSIATYYGPYIRSTVTHQPSLKCPQKDKDLFTLRGNAGEGNGALTKPIGIITSDETMYAGGYSGKENTGYWLYTTQANWFMSPYYYSGSYPYVGIMGGDGSLTQNITSWNTPGGLRPVINLKFDTKFGYANPNNTDIGTSSNPYVVVTE